MRILIATCLGLLCIACSNDSSDVGSDAPMTKAAASQINTNTPHIRENENWLSEQEAILRHQQISNLNYNLYFDLTNDELFSGVSELNFQNASAAKSETERTDLTIDFYDGKVEWVKVNGVEAPFKYNGFFISLKNTLIKSGKNKVEISFQHAYSKDGAGLYRYQDSTDNKVYLYTHFEPYSANKMFPGFDQPNLRATFDLKVKAPQNWTVISAAQVKSTNLQNDDKEWLFETSPNHSTYIFPLHAGEYKVWQDQFENIPLRLFARQSLAQHVDYQWWFDVTKKGLAFYNEYFDYPYPFKKYDQLIVPDFNIGGMENLAAVTYTEGLVSRGEVTASRKEGIAGLMLHEMSHMWFGDIITIDWWSGLWLKESFASYMENLALEKTDLSQNSWNRFYTGTKQNAYHADGLVTTHAIQMPVADTKNGVASFDSITYEKGASVLNQLTHYLGDTVFKEGVRAYFKHYDYQATKLPDFMDTLGKVAKVDLKGWTNEWLYQAGANNVQVEYSCANGLINQFNINQTAPEGLPTLRTHRSQIGLYRLDKTTKALQKIKVQPVTFSGSQTSVADLIGSDCPDLVYPNHSDWGYMKVLLDDKTLQNVPEAISYVDDPMLKAMLYQSLWDLVGEVQLSVADFIDMTMANLSQESDMQVLELVMNKLTMSRDYLNLFNLENYPDKEKYLAKLEDFYWQSFMLQKPASDHQKIWADRLIAMSQSPAGITRLAELLSGERSVEGFTLDQDYRWALFLQLMAMDHPQANELLEQEIKRDPSHQGALYAISAKAAAPDLAQKIFWFEQLEKENDRPTAAKQKAAIYRLFLPHQTGLINTLADRAISDLIEFDKTREQNLIRAMVYYLTPMLCTQENVSRLEKAIQENPQLGLIAIKGLKEKHQAEKQCVKLSQFGR